MDKIKILVAPNDKWACDKYRCSEPHLKLQEIDSDFEVTINYDVDWNDFESLCKYDILQIHSGIYKDTENVINALLHIKGKVYIIDDIDDYWELPKDHEAYKGLHALNYKQRVINLLKLADCVTATTFDLAEHVKEYNTNVYVIPNAVDFSKSQTYKNKFNRIRFGLVGSRSHYHDYLQLKDVTKSLPKKILDKCQFILCGFTRDVASKLKNGKIVSEKYVNPNNIWLQYEKLLTNDYKILDSQYARMLKTYEIKPYINKHPYRRMYRKNISDYLEFYKDVDVLMAPLIKCDFNNCKSNLKFLEAGQTGTAVIATNTGPFKEGIDLRNNPNGNCLLVEPTKESWIEAITTFVEHPELIELSKKNMSSFIKSKYDLKDVTKYRAELYKNLLKWK